MTSVASTDQPADHPAGRPADAASPAEVAKLRARIDEIDQALIRLWQERAALSQRVGVARVAAGGTRLALAREREVLDRFHRALGPLGTQLGLLILRAGRGAL
jgi:chorismate mutase